jgi:Zn-dependent peptidase ImmA (M78 family)
MMKVKRRMIPYRKIAVELCKIFILPLPCTIEEMRVYNWKNSSSGKIILNHDSNHYKIRLKLQEVSDNGVTNIPKEKIVFTLCHELAHTRYHEHNAQHICFTNQLYEKAKELMIE